MNLDELMMSGVVALMSIVGYLLSSKDKAQQDEIAHLQEECRLLNAKHEVDVMALQELRIKIAGNHYEKAEMDAKFDRLESTISTGLLTLGTKFDKLSDQMMTWKNHD